MSCSWNEMQVQLKAVTPSGHRGLYLLTYNQIYIARVLQGSAEELKMMLCPIMVLTLTGSDSEARKDLDPAAADGSTVALHVCVCRSSQPVLKALSVKPFGGEAFHHAMRGCSVPCVDNLCCLLYGCFTDAMFWRHMGLQSLELAQQALSVRSLCGTTPHTGTIKPI